MFDERVNLNEEIVVEHLLVGTITICVVWVYTTKNCDQYNEYSNAMEK